MYSFVLLLLFIIIIFILVQNTFPRQKEGLGTQNNLPAYFSPFTLNNIPLKMIYWSNRLNGDATTGNIDPYTVSNDLKTTARTLNIILYGDENGVNQKFTGMMSSVPFTINNLPMKMNLWANRLNGDATGGTTDLQSIAYEIQYSSFLLNQVLNGGDKSNSLPPVQTTSRPETTTTRMPETTTRMPETTITRMPETTITRMPETTTRMPETTITTRKPETTITRKPETTSQPTKPDTTSIRYDYDTTPRDKLFKTTS